MALTGRTPRLAVALAAGTLSIGALGACADAAGATPDRAAATPGTGGAPREIPQRGVGAGGGATAGVEDLGAIVAGATALAASGGLALVARRRRGEA